MKTLRYISLILVFFGCKKNTQYSEIKKVLERVLVDDQKFRQPYYDYAKQNPIDDKNIKIVTKIIDSLGWLGEDKVGKDANLALFIAIQHARKLSTMEKYLPIMKEAVKKGNVKKCQLAYLIDRVELLNNRKQIYGTQLTIKDNGNFTIENIIDSSTVNIRRKSMDLEPIENYLKMVNNQ
ncbi:MAG: hypothetical protein JST62_05915 [Bacteroidetes bacterium]|jgi:tagatose-1,6-bisphosphate aldolase non-catalytic subunit AgaZ/GatZ|nr:hypothetical protein [Bacteroidota bacterium]